MADETDREQGGPDAAGDEGGAGLFPRWANYVVPALILGIIGGVPYLFVLVGFGAAPSTTWVGYQPEQPVAFSHDIHVTQLGMDCRYCHTTVEDASMAAVPATETCMNCHHAVEAGSRAGSREDVAKIREAFESGESMDWTRVHDLPGYAYFDHSVHVNAGVSCVSCHGRVDRMDGGEDRVHQVNSLSMGWCLDCHRNPEEHLRPSEEVTNLMWGLDQTQEQRLELGQQLAEDIQLRDHRQMTDCSSCHR